MTDKALDGVDIDCFRPVTGRQKRALIIVLNTTTNNMYILCPLMRTLYNVHPYLQKYRQMSTLINKNALGHPPPPLHRSMFIRDTHGVGNYANLIALARLYRFKVKVC